jgi:hypothetical protein
LKSVVVLGRRWKQEDDVTLQDAEAEEDGLHDLGAKRGREALCGSKTAQRKRLQLGKVIVAGGGRGADFVQRQRRAALFLQCRCCCCM